LEPKRSNVEPSLDVPHEPRRLGALARAALAEWGLGRARLRLLRNVYNTTFRVDDRYVLRIQWPGRHDAAAVRSEMLWLAALRRDTALVVPEPVPTRRGELVVVAAAEGVPEPRACALLGWVEGRFVRDRLTPAHLERVGALTARLHDHGLGFAPPPGFTRPPIDDVDDATVESLVRVVSDRASREAGAVARAALAKIRLAQAEVGRSRQTYGLIHADLHHWNYLFHRDEARAIDFDDCGFGHALYDLAVTEYLLRGRPAYPELRAALLRGYRRERALPPAHEARLESFVALRRIQDMASAPEAIGPTEFKEWAEGARGPVAELAAFLAS
jgi:Ser/Thr protein kinase RdoA (MazF antagonist)